MATKLLVSRLDRITLVQKGRFTAKHPELRNGVVEFVKAQDDDDWYADFTNFILNTPGDEIPDEWCAAFAQHIEKASKNAYPASRGPFAGPHHSFPIKTQQDVYDAARLIGHAQDPAAVKAKIIRLARRQGFSLPTSWQKTVKKADIIEAVKALGQFLAGDPSLVEDDVPDDLADLEKARAKASDRHSHPHSHVSMYGYSTYEHNHDHDHRDGVTPDSDDHAAHETAHAHQHISKAGDDVTPEEAKLLQDDNAGLKADLEKALDATKTLEARVAEVEKSLEEKDAQLAAVEKAKADAEAAQAEAVTKAEEAEKKLVEASRQPLTAAPTDQKVQKAQVTPDMKFDDALKTLLHS